MDSVMTNKLNEIKKIKKLLFKWITRVARVYI